MVGAESCSSCCCNSGGIFEEREVILLKKGRRKGCDTCGSLVDGKCTHKRGSFVPAHMEYVHGPCAKGRHWNKIVIVAEEEKK